MKEIIATKDVYVLCHNNDDIIHFVFLKSGNKMVTGQPFIEQFTSIEEVKKRVEELNGSEQLIEEINSSVNV